MPEPFEGLRIQVPVGSLPGALGSELAGGVRNFNFEEALAVSFSCF